MFCPSCGSEERQATQFCRACGTDLRAVRVSLERPDSITASAVTAREEIGRAVAQKIREIEGARDLERVAEDVLPQIEKFLESYEEKRLRRMRAGVITAAFGFGTCVVGLLLATIISGELGTALTVGGAGLGFLMFLVGLGLVLNGKMLSRPRRGVEDNSQDADLQNLLETGYAAPELRAGGEAQPTFRAQTTSNLTEAGGSSVTEHTTHHLKTEQ
jgi:hypothetical protein